MARALLIVNPFASRVSDDAVERVAAALGDVEVARTQHRGHATELVHAAGGEVEAIYVFSGDGGFNEALNGSDGRTPLGFVPGGGTSVLPRALGLPRDPVAAARWIAFAQPRRISVGRVNGRRFGFSAGLGLDAELIRRVEALGRTSEGRRAGDVAFARTALALLWERRFRLEPVIKLRSARTSDTVSLSPQAPGALQSGASNTVSLTPLGRVAFALVANCDPYTYVGRVALRAAPQARFELGLDAVGPRAVRASTIPRFLAYAVRGGGQERARDVVYGHDLDRLEAVCDRPLPLQADGEDLGDVTEAFFEAERDAVAVLA